MKTRITIPLFVAFAAAAFILGTSAFKKAENKAPDKKNFVTKLYQLTTLSTPMDKTAYTEISQATYDSLSCSGSATICKIKAVPDTGNPSHPQQLVDGNNDGLPDQDGTWVTQRFLRANP